MIRLLLLFCGTVIFAQNAVYITQADEITPVAGAKIFCGSILLGSTDVKGVFNYSASCEKLSIKAAGYFDEEVKGNAITHVSLMVKTGEREIDEVKLTDESDPRALAILEKVIAQFEKNKPQNQDSYSFKAYNKFYIDLYRDSIDLYRNYFEKREDSLKRISSTGNQGKPNKDSIERETTRKMMLESGMFIGERALQYKYSKSGGQHIDVLDSRISGVQQPIYEALALASNIDRLPNAIQKKSWKFYRFFLTDSIQMNGRETYLINFRRANATNKDKRYIGSIYIDKESAAVAKYELQSKNSSDIAYAALWKPLNGSWFLEKERTRFKLGNVTFKEYQKNNQEVEASDDKTKFGRYATMENTFFDFKAPDEKLTKKDFQGYAFRVLHSGGDRLEEYRNRPLDHRELATYPKLDSVFHAKKYDYLINKGSNILRGRIRFGIVDFPVNQFLDLNRYENVRIGTGVKLNEKFNQYISPDAYVAYGFRDHRWKYGLGLDVNTTLSREAFLRAEYRDDVAPAGKFNNNLWSGIMKWRNSAASMGTFNFYEFKGFGLSYEDHLTDNFTFRVLARRQDEAALFPYDFQGKGNRFTNSNLTFTARYVFGSKSIMTPSGQYNVVEGFPQFFVNYEKGLSALGGELDYNRFDFLAIHQFKSSFGVTGLRLYGGLATGDAPIWRAFEGGGFRSEGKDNFWNKVHLNTFLGFGTMKSGEFYNDRFIGYFVGHRIPWYFKWLLKERSAFNLIYKGMIGDFKNQADHTLNFRPTNHLYQEVGFEWDNFFTSFINLGFYYRVGYYQTPKFSDNFSFEVRVKLLEF